MHISKIHIENFKIFKEFNLPLYKGVNILVGNNEAGKSTIIEAIHLVLTGLYNGKYLKNELTQYIFNYDVVSDYLKSLGTNIRQIPPNILIEIFIQGDDLAEYLGDGNSDKSLKEIGFSLKILFDDTYRDEYEKLLEKDDIKSIPIEYYKIVWASFARDENITPRTIPLKSALIDSSSSRFQNGSDIYISRIVKDKLEKQQIVEISQAHRKMKDQFSEDKTILNINQIIENDAKIFEISNKKIELSVELSSQNAWESSLIMLLNKIPFHFIGKGEQSLIKTKLALAHKKSKEANILLFEEPENHLSHAKLNQLIKYIEDNNGDKQILISTHNSFVANKLGLKNITLLDDKNKFSLKELSEDTFRFFQKLAGYDTLRLILCKKAILVEGDSDELIVQKAYLVNNGKLPIEDEIDIISVGTSFLRFLEIAEKIKKNVVVVTDNDGNIEALNKKYKDYLGNNKKNFIDVCFDETVDEGILMIGNKPFNYNTLEPKLLKANSLEILNVILATTYTNIDDMHKFMKENKTECALKIFETTENFIFPEYILAAIQ
jgi:putative ATP-dependent endonuclease of OLD family